MDKLKSQYPKIFISYCQKYTKLMQIFAELLRSMELEPIIFDYGADQSVFDKAKDLISNSDGVIGLLTPDDETKDGKMMYSRSVQAEISMAYANNKKIQLIAINSPDLSGLPYQTNTVLNINIDEKNRIEQDSLPKLFKTLRNFENGLREIIDSLKPSSEAPMKYKAIDFSQKILSDQETILKIQYSALALKNVKSRLHHNELQCFRKNGQSLQLENGEDDIELKVFEPKNVRADLHLLINEPALVKYRVNFEPQLDAGTAVSYGYQRHHKNYLYYTFEELEEAISENRLLNIVMQKEKKIGEYFEISMPTDRLKITFEFPAGYPIKNVTPIVMNKDDLNKAETERVKEFLKQEKDPFSRSTKLVLDILDPKLTYSYFLLYEPPHSSDI